MEELSIDQIKEIYGIKQAAAYKWRRYLTDRNIKPTQENLTALRDHISSTGGYSGFMEGGELATVENSLKTTPAQEAEFTGEGNAAITRMVHAAQNKATAILIAEQMLTKEFIDNPEALPEELQQKVKQAEAIATPKPVDPLQYAQELVRKRKQQMQEQQQAAA
ncbi:hypothetical protein NDI37_21880 [Funiculus sociatus GB2-A5]|uniref:Uncharacterized protein n=1 Tax=Funiculus sociatus GB2-A5 TaxID=2933946 RepID=A0ABV0JUG8_9CYAN|nr:hypothetical protein [Trichocoleus sp. FACHB-6]MBD2060746.1 hypothetical protein [Trichocoleus sp. FACHB-6]